MKENVKNPSLSPEKERETGMIFRSVQRNRKFFRKHLADPGREQNPSGRGIKYDGRLTSANRESSSHSFGRVKAC